MGSEKGKAKNKRKANALFLSGRVHKRFYQFSHWKVWDQRKAKPNAREKHTRFFFKEPDDFPVSGVFGVLYGLFLWISQS